MGRLGSRANGLSDRKRNSHWRRNTCTRSTRFWSMHRRCWRRHIGWRGCTATFSFCVMALAPTIDHAVRELWSLSLDAFAMLFPASVAVTGSAFLTSALVATRRFGPRRR